jgi:ABC-2 type transport system ATP-binding protein
MRYGDTEVLKGIDLEVATGEILGFLGPNGAGKTTTIEILEGYRQRTAGDVDVLGVDPSHPTRAWRDRIGLVLQECELDPLLTVSETLQLFSAFYRKPRRMDEVISLVGLTGREQSRLGTLSGGQRRRADVAVALIGDPDLIFLDEPTTGFDPTARREAWTTIEGLRELGKTVLLTTHYMEEASFLSDRVAILRAGEIIAEGRPDQITGQQDRQATIRFLAPEGLLPQRIADAIAHPITSENGNITFQTDDVQAALLRLTVWADHEKLTLEAIEVRQPSLEDVFLELTKTDSKTESSSDG